MRRSFPDLIFYIYASDVERDFWNERERGREISNCAGHREEFSSKEKIIRYQGEEGKKVGKDSIADESSPTFLLRPNSFLSAQQDRWFIDGTLRNLDVIIVFELVYGEKAREKGM